MGTTKGYVCARAILIAGSGGAWEDKDTKIEIEEIWRGMERDDVGRCRVVEVIGIE